jgi:catechol 2,3-dioxygenase-like lactoylglutathione lyase family enzyme
MVDSARLVAFVAARNLKRARDFYVDILGCGLIEMTPYACVVVVGNTELRITNVEYFEPQPFTVLGFEVGDVHEEVRRLRGLGVQFREYAAIEQDDDGVWEVPGGGKVAWFLDPDGNTLSVQRTEAAHA